MKDKFLKILKQALSFFLISGIGWIFDFATYIFLTKFLSMGVAYANMISAIPAFTYVFATSNKKIFKNTNSKIALKYKYLIYFIYQIVLVICVSFFGDFIYNLMIVKITSLFIINNLKIIIKLLITPITMTLNFLTMKNLIEKL